MGVVYYHQMLPIIDFGSALASGDTAIRLAIIYLKFLLITFCLGVIALNKS